MRTSKEILCDYREIKNQFDPIAQEYHRLIEIMSGLKREYDVAQRGEFDSSRRKRAQEIIDLLSPADRRLLKSLL
jgi:hypothetical protein